MYETLKNEILEGAAESSGMKERSTSENFWWNMELEDINTKKRYLRWLETGEMEDNTIATNSDN